MDGVGVLVEQVGLGLPFAIQENLGVDHSKNAFVEIKAKSNDLRDEIRQPVPLLSQADRLRHGLAVPSEDEVESDCL